MNEIGKNLLEGVKGSAKSALSLIPGLGQAIAGYDAYKKSQHDRNVMEIIDNLNEKVDDLHDFFNNDWLKTKDGKEFSRKVIDATLDVQIEDKQELFINALINGIRNQDISQLERLKFIDMLRYLSKHSLMVLSEMDKMFAEKATSSDPTIGAPSIDPEEIAQTLSRKFNPYFTTSSINEMIGQGLFSNASEWREGHNGSYRPGAYNADLHYTMYTVKFVRFITYSTVISS